MKPAPFTLHRPTSLAEALDLLSTLGDDAKPLAGGQSLIPILAMRLTRFDHLIDLNLVEELSGITRDGESIVIGAMTRQAAIGADAVVDAEVPLLARATSEIGHFQIRSRGTIGGSLAHADPAAEYPAVLLALEASVKVTSVRGSRVVPAAELFEAMWTTSIAPDEIIESVILPTRTARNGSAISEITRRKGDFAMAGAVCTVSLSPDLTVQKCALGLFGVASTPVRAFGAEQSIIGEPADAVHCAGVADEAVGDLAPADDMHASSDDRTDMAAVAVQQSLRRALQDAMEKTA